MNITNALRSHIVQPSFKVISMQNKLVRNALIIWLFFKFCLQTGIKIAYEAYNCTLTFTWRKTNIIDKYDLLPKSLHHVCDDLLLSFKAFVIFMTRFLMTSLCTICEEISNALKAFVIFAARFLIDSKPL